MYKPVRQEEVDVRCEVAERLMTKALCAGLKALQISGYDKLATANSPVLAIYIAEYVKTVRLGLEE